MKIVNMLVAGSRGVTSQEYVTKWLNHIIATYTMFQGDIEIVVISGGAKGVDVLGEAYALEQDYMKRVYYAEWQKYGLKAGMLRNVEMGAVADIGVIFWDGTSRGTANMIEILEKAGKAFIVVCEDAVLRVEGMQEKETSPVYKDKKMC